MLWVTYSGVQFSPHVGIVRFIRLPTIWSPLPGACEHGESRLKVEPPMNVLKRILTFVRSMPL
jgi:hypothetical protein